jgi:hypothetical protein
MSSPALRKAPGTPADRGIYRVSGGPWEDLGPGRRVVKELRVSDLNAERGGAGSDALTALVRFPDLRTLWLERVHGIDLAPLADTFVEDLRLEVAGGLDLSPLSGLPTVAGLDLLELDEDCEVPARLTLPTGLRRLLVGDRRPGKGPGVVPHVLSAIEWGSLGRLCALSVIVEGAVVDADLGFLRHLSALESLWITGVRHSGRARSPLVPPFDGLSTALARAIFEADDPEVTREALRRHLVDAAVTEPQVSVRQSVRDTVDRQWTPRHDSSTGNWVAYGRLADAFELPSNKTEHDALLQAQRRVRKADPQLLKRLDFDQEAGGTTIEASNRTDIERALQLLDLT